MSSRSPEGDKGAVADVDFSGAESKVVRARALLEEFKAEVARHLDAAVATIRHDVTADGRVHRYVLTAPPPIPAHWPLVVGDIVHNARTALDHAAWQLHLAAGLRPDRTTSFGMLLAPQDDPPWAELPIDLRNALEREQPYATSSEIHPARLIHELDRIDKHRILLPAVVAAQTVAWSGSPTDVQGVNQLAFTHGGEVLRLEYAEAMSQPGARFDLAVWLDDGVDAELTSSLADRYVRRGDLPHWALGVGVQWVGRTVARLREASEAHTAA